MNKFKKIARQSGFSLIEILITMIIMLIGLLGIAALQAQAQMAEMESYQRAQALIIMSDIVDRMNLNRNTVACFGITTNTTAGTPYLGATGTGHAGTPTCTASTGANNTMALNAMTAINNQLQGAAETSGGTNVGAMIGARTCISYDATTEINSIPGTGLYTIIVTWQALNALTAPTLNCANNLYGNENMRRAVSTQIRFADLI